MTAVSELIKKLMEMGAPLDAALYAASVFEAREKETSEEIGRLRDADKARREKRAEQKRKERMSRDSRTTGGATVATTSHDLPSLNGFPPAPIYKNNTPPSLNPPINNRHSAHFEHFWKVYPRKVGKGQASKAWAAAVRKAEPERIIEGVERYPWPDDPSFIPHASTWLNGQRWEDELPGMKPRKLTQAELDEQERKRIEFLKDLHRRAGHVSENN